MRWEGESVIGLTIMPLSDRFTRSTSDACSSIDRFLWMTPSPPCCAMAMARRDSVTVSIAALTSGTDRRIRRVRRVVTSTWVGTTSECCGTSSTSSKVRAVASPTSVERSVGSSVFRSIDCSGCGAVTLLVFLAAPAPARVVAADLGLIALDRLDDVVAADTIGLPLLGARSAERARRLGRRPTGGWQRRRSSRARIVQRERGLPPRHRPARHLRFLIHDRAQAPEVADDRLVDAILHPLEQAEA